MKNLSGALLILLTSAGLAQAVAPPILTAIANQGGSEPVVNITNQGATGPETAFSSGPLSTVSTVATYRRLEVNVNGTTPSGGPSQQFSTLSDAKWNDLFTFTPDDEGLLGTSATATFSFSFGGTWDHEFNAGGFGSVSYRILFNDGSSFATGMYSTNGDSGNLDPSSLATFTKTKSFTIGTPFSFESELRTSGGINNSPGPGGGSADLSFYLELTNVSTGEEGTWTRASGAAIPEPAVWEEAPAVLLLGAVLMRRKIRR